MVDSQVLEMSKIATTSFLSVIIKILIPGIILIGAIDLLLTLIFKKKKK